MFHGVAVASRPDFTYCWVLALIIVSRIVWGEPDGLTLNVPGATRPSIRRWSAPIWVAGSTAHAGTDSEASGVFSAAARRSSAETHRLFPSKSTQLALEIIVKIPGVTLLVLTSVVSSSCSPSGVTTLPTRLW